ncbi:murein hydrolase activator EnvC family protein [Humibacillus xanthopallidus]|uniref:murein hydrolase activator EnvC family protein n=1 Tax=Humibacillus xanthopallidus TaxID=412689 RepID=UPI0038506D1E
MSFSSAVVSIALAVSAGVGAIAGPPAQSATAAVESGSAGAARWSWPLEPVPQVARRFDPPDQPWLPGHRGVDLVGTVGQVVRSPTAGTVTYAGRLAGRGVVVVSHADGLRSTFEPVTPSQPVGTAVAQGDPVGSIAAEPGHCAPASCLHWGVLRGRTYLDPLAFVGRARIVLLPLR